MKKLYYILVLGLVLSLMPSVSAFSIGDKITDIGATVPSDGTVIRFTLPQGDYPSDSKLLLYAQYGVLCVSPGVDYEEPTPDKNPYKLLAEYKFTENDLAALKNGESEFTTTLKFDPECGAIMGQLVKSDEKGSSSIAEDNRPQGDTESSDGKHLTVYSSGMKLNVNYSISNGILTFVVPQGSYVQGDYVVVAKDGIAITSLSIHENIMKALVDGPYISKTLVSDVAEGDELTFFVSSVLYESGESVDENNLTEPEYNPETDLPINKDEKKGLSPIVTGVAVFVLVLAVGFGFMYFDDKRKKAKKQ